MNVSLPTLGVSCEDEQERHRVGDDEHQERRRLEQGDGLAPVGEPGPGQRRDAGADHRRDSVQGHVEPRRDDVDPEGGNEQGGRAHDDESDEDRDQDAVKALATGPEVAAGSHAAIIGGASGAEGTPDACLTPTS